ncbi:hypothetical protein K439DRAFT_1627763 [Ramaria rubella]|nr:hypothetical protein K439DRAFT_1627763 [Ramaria rubella]
MFYMLGVLKQVRVAATRVRSLSSHTTSQRIPWFISPDDPDFPFDAPRLQLRPPVQPTSNLPPLPEDTPEHLRLLHAELCTSPYLETSSLKIIRPVEPPPGPPLPFMRPRGSRRKRGGTDSGVGIEMPINGLWSWFLLAQVKEGTERKGSINRVIKDVNKALRQLASHDPSLILPSKRKRAPTDGWAMLDVGEFAVHILSRTARETWFPKL